jgi:hypothetical protein
MVGVFAVYPLKLARVWLAMALVPVGILTYLDKKYVPYTEIENLFKFTYERRKANSLFKSHHTKIVKELESVDKTVYHQLQADLTKANKTLYEASNALNSLYINSINDI